MCHGEGISKMWLRQEKINKRDCKVTDDGSPKILFLDDETRR